jgi:ATP synthase protein I
MSDQGPDEPHGPGTISEADRAAIKRRSHDLGDRLDRLREAHAPEKTGRQKPVASGAVGDALKMAIEPVVGVVAGVFVGLWVDNAMGTKPFGLIIGLLIGAAAGMLNLFRAARKTTRTPSDAQDAPPERRPDRN